MKRTKSPVWRGDRLCALREAKGLNPTQLAASAGCTAETIDSYEKGCTSPPADRLALICRALGCGPGYLMGMTEEVAA